VPTSVDPNKTNLITAKLPNISLKNGRKESLFFITFDNSENWGYGIPFFLLFDVDTKHQILFFFYHPTVPCLLII